MILSPWLCVCSELVAQGRDKGREREREIEGKRQTRTRMQSLTKYPRLSIFQSSNESSLSNDVTFGKEKGNEVEN